MKLAGGLRIREHVRHEEKKIERTGKCKNDAVDTHLLHEAAVETRLSSRRRRDYVPLIPRWRMRPPPTDLTNTRCLLSMRFLHRL